MCDKIKMHIACPSPVTVAWTSIKTQYRQPAIPPKEDTNIMDMFTVTFSITVFILFITVMDVLTNRLISERNKWEVFSVCIFIFISALCEYIGKEINGAPKEFIGIHCAAKVIEFCISPCIGIAAAKAFGLFERATEFICLLAVHAVFEIIAMTQGLVFRIDAENIYHRERFYFIYVAAFFLSMAYCYVCIFRGNKKYQAKLGVVNVLALIFLTYGISIQMLYSDITVDFMCVAIGILFLYHHRGNVINQVDAMTKLLNRRCFENRMRNMKSPSYVLILDIDNFKIINDTFGHSEGNKCLISVADKIRATYGKYGFCYRIGGDEYGVVMYKSLDRLQSLNEKFQKAVNDLCSRYSDIFGVSVGYAYYDKTLDIGHVLKEADEMMYNHKKRKEPTAR